MHASPYHKPNRLVYEKSPHLIQHAYLRPYHSLTTEGTQQVQTLLDEVGDAP